MSRVFVVRGVARRDVEDARDWYELQQPGVGQEFVDEVGATLTRVRTNPDGYAADRRGVRKAPVGRFPYIVYYLTTPVFVVVFAVIHASRHPRSWRSRL